MAAVEDNIGRGRFGIRRRSNSVAQGHFYRGLPPLAPFTQYLILGPMTSPEPSTLPLILLAEDQQDDVFLMRRALKKAAVPNPIFVASDGQQAIEYLEGKGPYADRKTYPLPGLLLLDLKMPRMDGFDVLSWVQSQAALNALPIVVLSGSGLEEDVLKAKSLGADDYRVKPDEPGALTEIVHQLHSHWLLPPRLAA